MAAELPAREVAVERLKAHATLDVEEDALAVEELILDLGGRSLEVHGRVELDGARAIEARMTLSAVVEPVTDEAADQRAPQAGPDDRTRTAPRGRGDPGAGRRAEDGAQHRLGVVLDRLSHGGAGAQHERARDDGSKLGRGSGSTSHLSPPKGGTRRHHGAVRDGTAGGPGVSPAILRWSRRNSRGVRPVQRRKARVKWPASE